MPYYLHEKDWAAPPPQGGSKSSEFPKSQPCRLPYSTAQRLLSCRHVQMALSFFPKSSRRQLSPFSKPMCPHSCRTVSLSQQKSLARSAVGGPELRRYFSFPKCSSVCRGPALALLPKCGWSG